MEKYAAVALLAIALAAGPAESQTRDVPMRGTTSAAKLAPADGLKVEQAARLRVRGAGLKIIESGEGTLSLSSPICEVTLTDRNGNGRYEGKQVRRNGRMAATCPAADTSFSPSEVEAGDTLPALDRCRLHTTQDWTVACQPTRFGRDDGEPWTVLAGFRSNWSASGRPDSLGWDSSGTGGLLIWDDHSGALYRVVEVDPEPEVIVEATPEPEVKPLRPAGSRLYTLTKSPERDYADAKREEALGRAREDLQGDSEGSVSSSGE